MDIIFVVDQLNVGGIATSHLRWAKALVDEGYKVAIFCQKQAGNYLPQVPPEVQLEVADAPRAFFASWRLYRFLRQYPQAVVIASAYTSAYVHFLKPRQMKNWLIMPNSPMADGSLAVAHGRASRFSIIRYLYRYAVQRANLVSAVSHGAAREVETWAQLPPNSVHTLYNPAYTPAFAHAGDNPPPHPWLADKQLRTFVTCGRLALTKNYPHLIRAFHRAYLQNQNLRLLILGEGEYRTELEQLIQTLFQAQSSSAPPPVALVGNQPQPGDYMAHAAAFVSSSQVEGFGNVIVEALATGVPVIATDAPHGPQEILAQGAYGVIVPRYDEAALAAALSAQTYPSTPAARQQRAQEFSAAALFPNFLAQYNTLLAQK